MKSLKLLTNKLTMKNQLLEEKIQRYVGNKNSMRYGIILYGRRSSIVFIERNINAQDYTYIDGS